MQSTHQTNAESQRKETMAITVEIAGAAARILCRYRENFEFLLPYATTKEAQFTVEVGEADVEFSKELLKRSFGEPRQPYNDCFLENLSIQNMLSRKLLDDGVLQIHGSALCMDGEGYIFTAPSGTGKSTHARFWRETFGERVWMINDDKPMVRLADGKATVYGTPWAGKHRLNTNASAPLKAIVWLTRDTENHIAPMAKADAFPVLMGQTAWARTGPQKPQTMRLLKELLDAAAFYHLGCNLDPEAARIAWQGMQSVRPGSQTKTCRE